MKAHAKNFVVVSPMEVLGLRDDVQGVEAAMEDGVHLDNDSQDALVEHIVKRVEEQMVVRKRGPTEKAGPPEKRTRSDGDAAARTGGGGRGGWSGRGWGRGGRGGAWGRGAHVRHSYSGY